MTDELEKLRQEQEELIQRANAGFTGSKDRSGRMSQQFSEGVDATRKAALLRAETTQLLSKLKLWNGLPEPIKGKTSAQIAEYVERAKAGDGSVQQFLQVLKSCVIEGKVDLGKIPSLDWQAKDPSER